VAVLCSPQTECPLNISMEVSTARLITRNIPCLYIQILAEQTGAQKSSKKLF
jgi:hypothetical protein